MNDKNHTACQSHSGAPHSGGAGQRPDPEMEERLLKERMSQVKHKILVLSGKGGVGKSTVAVNLAFSLAKAGLKVGLMDVDVHGPSIPAMLGLDRAQFSAGKTGGIQPVPRGDVKVVSIGFMLPDSDTPVIWRGPLKMGLIQQFLRDVEWGPLDYLVVDAPPGTGDEPLSVGQLLPEAEALIVTTPQRISAVDVRKSIMFCRKLNLPVMGVVENMNGLVCPHCGEHIEVFPSGETSKMVDELNVPLLASLPMDPSISAVSDKGEIPGDDPNSIVHQRMEPLTASILKRHTQN